MGENKKVAEKKEEPKETKDKKKKEPIEFATYLTDSLAHSALAPGPGN